MRMTGQLSRPVMPQHTRPCLPGEAVHGTDSHPSNRTQGYRAHPSRRT
jgi:hypothetical protein